MSDILSQNFIIIYVFHSPSSHWLPEPSPKRTICMKYELAKTHLYFSCSYKAVTCDLYAFVLPFFLFHIIIIHIYVPQVNL